MAKNAAGVASVDWHSLVTEAQHTNLVSYSFRSKVKVRRAHSVTRLSRLA